MSNPTPGLYEGQHTPIKQIASSALLNVAGMQALWTAGQDEDDEDDEPLEVPKFHFDWLSEEDKQRVRNDTSVSISSKDGQDRREGSTSSTSGRESGSSSNSTTLTAVPIPRSTLVSLGKPSRAPRSSSSNSISDPSHLTPPQHGYGLSKSTSTGGSVQSSASSARVASLTDASTASGSSVPTPPYAGSHHSRTSLSSYGSGGSGSGESGGGRPAPRTYSSRPFQRHVSAPLARDRLVPEDTKDSADVSISISLGTLVLTPGD